MPYLGKSPSFGVRQRYQYTATASQTTFSGTDTANLTLNYTDNNFVDVYQNGVLLKGGGNDYTATSGTSVVLGTGATADDVIEIIVYDAFSAANFYSRTDSDSRYVNVDGDSMTGALTITLDNNDTQLTLKSTDADANVGPFLDLNRDSGSPADGDFLGKIQFSGDDDGGNKLNYAFIDSKILDASNGSEDGQLDFYTAVGGSSVSRMQLGSETVFNQDSVDVDFRVESNGNANAFVVNGGTNRIGMGTDSPVGSLHIKDFVDSDGADVTLVIQNGSSSRQAAYLIHDEGGTVAAKLQYDNGGNTVTIGSQNDTVVNIIQGGTNVISIATDLDVSMPSSNLTVGGSVSKSSGSFKIDHPLESKKDTHYLVHSFIEGPQADLIYRGEVTLSSGTATVNIDTVSGMTDGTFVSLNTNVQCFTNNESGWTAVKGSVSGNTLTITAQDNSCTDTISWMVVGERHDAHMKESKTKITDANGKIIVEPKKEEPKKEEESE